MAPSLLSATLTREAPPDYDDSQNIKQLSSYLAGTGLSELQVQTEIPNVSQTICHLKLLHAISKLKEKVINANGLYELYDPPTDQVYDGYEDLKPARDLLRLRVREKRWAVFVQQATDRFSDWWSALKQWSNQSNRLTVKELLSYGGKLMPGIADGSGDPFEWIRGKLPPLGEFLANTNIIYSSGQVFLNALILSLQISSWFGMHSS